MDDYIKSTHIFDALLVEEYRYSGKKRRKFHKIGQMRQKNGNFTLYIPEGMSISGKIWITPAGMSEEEIFNNYESAADELGL